VTLPVGKLLRLGSSGPPELSQLQLGALEAALLGRILMRCRNITHLTLTSNELGAAGVRELAHSLVPNETAGCGMLTSLELGDNALCGKRVDEAGSLVGNWDASGVQVLAKAVKESSSLSSLTLSDNVLDAPAMTMLAEALTPDEDNKFSSLNGLVMQRMQVRPAMPCLCWLGGEEVARWARSGTRRDFALVVLTRQRGTHVRSWAATRRWRWR
jgi:hypothetical protein